MTVILSKSPPAVLVRPRIRFYLPILSGLGFICLIAAQGWLTISRQPIVPLVLYAAGFLLLRPALNLYAHEAAYQFRSQRTTEAASISARWPYWLGALVLAIIGTLLARSVPFVPFIVVWLASVGLVIFAANGTAAFPRLGSIRRLRLLYGTDAALVLVLMLAAIYIQIQTPAPAATLPEQLTHLNAAQSTPLIHYNLSDAGPLWHYLEALFLSVTAYSLNALRYLGVIFAILTIPAVYAFGRSIGGREIGLAAAGFCAVCGWTLALSRSLNVYSALAFISTLYLAVLYRAGRTEQLTDYVKVGLLFGVGWLLSPLFGYMALLIPVSLLFRWLDKQAAIRSVQTNMASVLLAAGVMILPFAAARGTLAVTTEPITSALSSTLTTLDALATSALMFNLTTDPSPLHGIINQPIFPPTIGALFLIGVFGWAWRINAARRWTNALLLIALLLALLPSAVFISPPLSYPHVYRAAIALPLAFTLAGIGASVLIRSLSASPVRIRAALIVGVFVAILVIVATDAQRHYLHDFIPTYQRTAPIFTDLTR